MNLLRPLRPLLFGWLLALLGWAALAFVVAYGLVANTPLTWIEALQAPVRDWLPWTIAGPLLFRFVHRHPFEREKWLVRLAAHGAVFALFALLSQAWFSYLDIRPAPAFERFGGPMEKRFPRRTALNEEPGPGPRRPPDFAPEDGPRGPGPHAAPPADAPALVRGQNEGPRGGPDSGLRPLGRVLSGYLLLATAAHAVAYYRRAKERETSLANARLESLRLQLQPHFLFNTLNTISGLVHTEPDRADTVVTALSDLLRLTLETSGERELPLREELRLVEAYLAIMQARFEDRVRARIEIAPDVRDALLPAFLLQPLVENAVHHGLEPLPAGGTVTVRAQRDGDRLKIEVCDDGAGLDPAASRREGVGLGNTRARLRALHGERASLDLRPAPDGARGCIVAVTLPYRSSPASSPA